MAAERGSSKLMRDRFERGISAELIEGLSSLENGKDINLWDVWMKGQPPRIDDFAASYFVHVDQLGSLIKKMFETYEGIPLRVLIHGQPPRIDMTQVDFQTPGF